MTGFRKIALIILVVIAVIAVIGAALIAIWARPNRLSQDKCTEMVRLTWALAQDGVPVGDRVFEYRLGERVYREKVDRSATFRYSVITGIISDLFPQTEPDDEFFGRLKIRHMGRVRIAGVSCEKIRLSPREYSGGSTELWIDPETNHTMSWRHLDTDGSLIRGYRFREIDNHAVPVNEIPETDRDSNVVQDSSIPGNRELIPADALRELCEIRQVSLPEWVPPGFELIGGRPMHSFDPPTEFDGMNEIGRMVDRPDMPNIPGRGPAIRQFQVIYSDGLNTISVIQLATGRVVNARMDPEKIQGVLDAKGREVNRIFHTSMVSRVLPGAVIIVIGDVAQDHLRQVIGSIPDRPIEPDPNAVGIRPPGPGRNGPMSPDPDRPRFFDPRGRRPDNLPDPNQE